MNTKFVRYCFLGLLILLVLLSASFKIQRPPNTETFNQVAQLVSFGGITYEEKNEPIVGLLMMLIGQSRP